MEASLLWPKSWKSMLVSRRCRRRLGDWRRLSIASVSAGRLWEMINQGVVEMVARMFVMMLLCGFVGAIVGARRCRGVALDGVRSSYVLRCSGARWGSFGSAVL